MEIMKTNEYDSASPIDNHNSHQCGLSKLEAFTMAAIQGLCASVGSDDYIHPLTLAQQAVAIAKATILELNSQPQTQ